MRIPEPDDPARRTTIADVASLARVSTATVSRLLAGSGPVAPVRAARVRAAVEQLGYVPNEAARELSSRIVRRADVGMAGETVARYLIGLGHRRAGVVATRYNAAVLRDYIAAARRTFAAVGGDLAEVLTASDEYDIDAGLVPWFAGPERRTAILCGEDLTALAVVECCTRQGIAIPGAQSVVGFGDAKWTAWVRPRLTTVRLPAVAVPGEGGPIPCQLVVRQSTGPVPTG